MEITYLSENICAFLWNCYVEMTEATGRISWYLLKYQSIITDNIFTKIGYFWLYLILFLVVGTFL